MGQGVQCTARANDRPYPRLSAAIMLRAIWIEAFIGGRIISKRLRRSTASAVQSFVDDHDRALHPWVVRAGVFVLPGLGEGVFERIAAGEVSRIEAVLVAVFFNRMVVVVLVDPRDGLAGLDRERRRVELAVLDRHGRTLLVLGIAVARHRGAAEGQDEGERQDCGPAGIHDAFSVNTDTWPA